MSIPTETATSEGSGRIRIEDAPDEGQLPGDGSAGAAELIGDGIGGEPVHPEDGDLAEDIVAESFEEPSIFFGEDGGALGGGLRADNLSQKLVVIAAFKSGAGQPSAALFAGPAAILRLDLPRGDDDQEPPKVVAVGQSGELTSGQPAAEAFKGTQGRILLVAAGVPAP